MRVLASTALLAAAAVSLGQSSSFGKTKSQALEMGFAQWDRHIKLRAGSDSEVIAGLAFFRTAARERNDRLIRRLPSKRKSAILAARRDGAEAGSAIAAANAAASGGGPLQKAEGMSHGILIELAFHRILTKAPMPKALISGNLFREIEDAWRADVEETAQGAGKAEEAKPLAGKAIQAGRKARESFSLLAERESALLRQVLAHFFSPDSFEAPFKL